MLLLVFWFHIKTDMLLNLSKWIGSFRSVKSPLCDKRNQSYLKYLRSFWNLRQCLKSTAEQNRRLWTLPTGDDMPLSMTRWISLGHGVVTAHPVALEHLLTSQSPSAQWSALSVFPKYVCLGWWVHSCTSPWHECVSNRCCSMSVCLWRGDGRILAKWTLQMPLIARWIRKEIPLGWGQRINS